MRRHKFSRWLNHPVSFLFWFFVGLFVLKFSSTNQPTEVTQMSSLEEEVDLSETNFNEIQALPDDELLLQLEQNTPVAFSAEDESQKDPYALTTEQIESIDHDIYNNPEYRFDYSYEPIADDSLKVQYEDPKNSKVCSGNRLFYEKQLTSNPKMKTLISSRTKEDPKLPKKCILHVMNQAGLSKSSLGLCAKAAGPVRIPGAKPCVTENLVNATYNSFVDVMDCLNLNPKVFFPKISLESGFMINAYGAGKDGGIGQFTQAAIDGVNLSGTKDNNSFEYYLKQMEVAASSKESCKRIMAYKSMLTKAVPSGAKNRCSMIGMPENPLRNVLYIGIFNRMQMDYFSGIKYQAGADFIDKDGHLVPVTYTAQDEFEGVAKANKYKESLEDLGIKNPNMHFFKEVLTLAGYNMGGPTAIRLFSKYLEKRKQFKKKLSYDDFDFNKVRTAKDVYGDGKEKNVIDIARSFVMSSFISRKDKQAARIIKLKKRKQLPKEWATSYLKSFPEFLAYNANNYDGKQIRSYSVYGAPGYASYVAAKNREMRNVFNSAGIDPDFCSDPTFLVFKPE